MLALQSFFGDMDISATNLVTPLVDIHIRPWLLEEFKAAQTDHVKETVENFRNKYGNGLVAISESLVSESRLKKRLLSVSVHKWGFEVSVRLTY